MGYTTDFYGEFAIFPPLEPGQVALINAISDGSEDWHPAHWCQWTVSTKTEWVPGADGEFVRNEDGSLKVLETPGAVLEWDQGEKFYEYVEWLKELIARYFVPWGRTLQGMVEWQGEEPDDMGQIHVTDNVMVVLEGRKVFDQITAIYPVPERSVIG